MPARGKQLENDKHLMFISLLMLAMLALFVGEANDRALSERESRLRSAAGSNQSISAGKFD